MTNPSSAWDLYERELRESACSAVYPGANLVIGRGSRAPRIVIVGEAPGAEEDKLQLPFVGRSGQLLDAWIHACGLTESEYYVCNVMKSRPPENRNPSASEISLCAPWLTRQLTLLQPQLIIAVGRFAMNYFLPKEKRILHASGKVHAVNGLRIFVMPHPSYFIRRGGKGWELYITELKKILEKK